LAEVSPLIEFEDQAEGRLSLVILSAGIAYRRSLQDALTEHDIPVAWWPFLRALWREEGLSQHALSERANVKDPTGFAVIKAMEAAGLVARYRKPSDQKRNFVFLTTKGRAARGVLVPVANGTHDVALQGIREEDIETTRRTLLKIVENLRGGSH
jgi:DNA-binding MarR family transcriptional regulator